MPFLTAFYFAVAAFWIGVWLAHKAPVLGAELTTFYLTAALMFAALGAVTALLDKGSRS